MVVVAKYPNKCMKKDLFIRATHFKINRLYNRY
jgi:hypothetical protein